MSVFRKSFKGYRVSDVDRRIDELESSLESATSQCALLEGQLAESRQAVKETREELAAREAELERMNQAYERLRREQNAQKTEAESIGSIYIKAFESGREIAAAPKPHIAEYLDRIERITERARAKMLDAKRDFAGMSGRVDQIASDIAGQADFIRRKLQELSVSIQDIDRIYALFNQVKEETNLEIDIVRANYEEKIGDYAGISNNRASDPRRSGQTGSLFGQMTEPEFAPVKPSVEEDALPDSGAQRQQEERSALSEDVAARGTRDDFAATAPAAPEEPGRQEKPEESSQEEKAESTYADFFSGEEESAEKPGSSEDPVEPAENPSEAKPAKAEQVVRGQNILNLLNKYKKQ